MSISAEVLATTQIRETKKLATFVRLVERDGAVCQHCGGAEDLTIDHVDPAGGDADENLQVLCRPCNSSKGTTTDDKTVRWADGIWQKGFTMIPNVVVLSDTLSVAAFRVYALFLYYAREGDEVWAGQDGLAEKTGLGERKLRDAIRELEQASLIQTRRRGLGKTNIYILLVPRNGGSRSAISAGQDRQTVPIPKKKTQSEEDTSLLVVIDAWRSNTGALIEHRESYFAAQRTQTAIRSALKVYPAVDVAAAIVNYATVIAGDEYRWSYRWTLIDFLKRGLDRFVPEADPLSNFRGRGQTGSGVSFDDIADL